MWMSGGSGCVKTMWVVNHFDGEKDVIAFRTTEIARKGAQGEACAPLRRPNKGKSAHYGLNIRKQLSALLT